MTGRSDAPLEGVVLDDVDPESIEPTELRAALESERSLVRQRGARVCATLAAGPITTKTISASISREFMALEAPFNGDETGRRKEGANSI